ncbi:MAG TPA: LPS assembly protein LptD [Terriglobales bacterium]
MNSRTRILITVAALCYGLMMPKLVTSQSPPPNGSQMQIPPTFPTALKEEEATIKALSQEKVGPLYMLHGNAEIHFGEYILYGDEIEYNSDTGDAKVEGHMVLDGKVNDEHIQAQRGTYNVRNETGRFENVVATIGARPVDKRLMLTTSNPFFIRGKLMEKTSVDHYLVLDGTVTTCELPNPKWQFNARKIDVEVGDTAKIYRSNFALGEFPILYFPYATLPAQKLPRQSGFLIPNFGTSTTKGFILGESVFWAINRSMDAHLGAEYYSKRGWAPQAEFRARPSDSSFVDVNYFQVLDRGIGSPPLNEGGEEIRVNAEDALPHNFRGVANVDYLSSYLFRLAFSEVFTQAVDSEVRSIAFLSNTSNNFYNNFDFQRYQDFQSATPGDVITILHAPGLESSTVDRQIEHSPLYWSYDAAAEGVSRTEPGAQFFSPEGNASLVGRFDVSPELSLPLHFEGWSIRPALDLRDTLYTQRLQVSSNGVATPVSADINRKALEASVDLRPPALEKVFSREWLGRKWKHVIEPQIEYNYVTGVDNFAKILRFDERDILSDTNEVEYKMVQRLYARKTSAKPENCDRPGMPLLFIGGAAPPTHVPWERQPLPSQTACNAGPESREVIRWELAQKYFIDPTFGGALQAGTINVFTTTAALTGTSFLTVARHLSPLISRLRVQTSSKMDLEWDLDYDFKVGQINSSTVFLNYRIGPFTVGGGDAFLRVPAQTNAVGFPAQQFNQYRLLAGYGHTGKPGLSVALNMGIDEDAGQLQYAAAQASYNWDCCGINVEFRRFNLTTVRDENQYRFTFALANLGALGNLRRTERLF